MGYRKVSYLEQILYIIKYWFHKKKKSRQQINIEKLLNGKHITVEWESPNGKWK